MAKKIRAILEYLKLRRSRNAKKDNQEYIDKKGYDRCLKELGL